MKKPDDKSKLQTHISEPRWQQIVSVIIVVIIIVIELLVVLKVL